jgi:hypothetical protein
MEPPARRPKPPPTPARHRHPAPAADPSIRGPQALPRQARQSKNQSRAAQSSRAGEGSGDSEGVRTPPAQAPSPSQSPSPSPSPQPKPLRLSRQRAPPARPCGPTRASLGAMGHRSDRSRPHEQRERSTPEIHRWACRAAPTRGPQGLSRAADSRPDRHAWARNGRARVARAGGARRRALARPRGPRFPLQGGSSVAPETPTTRRLYRD